jgi:cysteine-rich CPXCG protein
VGGHAIAGRLRRVSYSCAFCGEENEVFVDPSGGRRQTFTEDCTMCCRPNLITATLDDDGEVELDVTQEYEA